ncbi:MAG: hypothetical protein R3F43_17590 [bacterium]
MPVENVWLATSISPRALEEGDAQALAVARFGASLPPSQWARDGSRAGIEALVQAFAARLSADTAPNARARWWSGPATAGRRAPGPCTWRPGAPARGRRGLRGAGRL